MARKTELSSTQERAALMGSARIGKLLLQFAVPAILMNLVSSLYNMVDKIFVGNMIGDLAIAAATVANPVMRLLTSFAVLVGAGGNALLALRLGEGKHKEAEGILNNSFVLIAAISLTLSALGLIFLEPLLGLLGCSELALPYARTYVRIILIGGFFEAVTSGMGMFVRTDGKPKYMMACTVSGCLINIVLDPVMIGVFRWGIAGAAIATVFAQVISACLILYYFTLSKHSTIKLRARLLRLRADLTKTTCQLGTSSFISNITGALTQAIMFASLSLYAPTREVGVTLSIGLLFMMPIVGMQQAVQPILGYNYGARKYDRVIGTFKWAMISVTVMAVLGWAVILIWAEGLCRLFGANEQYMDIYARTMRMYNVTLPLVPVSLLGANVFQSIGKPKKAILLSLTRQVFALLPAVLLLPLNFGVDGVVSAMPVCDVISFVIGTLMVSRELREILRMRDGRLPAHE